MRRFAVFDFSSVEAVVSGGGHPAPRDTYRAILNDDDHQRRQAVQESKNKQILMRILAEDGTIALNVNGDGFTIGRGSPGRKPFGLFSYCPKLRWNCSQVLWYNLNTKLRNKSEFEEEHTVKKKIGVGIATLGITILCILLLKLFVIGEPVDGAQLAYNITQNDATLELQVSATESAVALKGWKIEQKGNNVSISTRKVLVSFLFSSGQYQTSINIDGIENVYLGGQIIWSSK